MLRQNLMVVGACAVVYPTVTRKQRNRDRILPRSFYGDLFP